jgi:hypothetical protein
MNRLTTLPLLVNSPDREVAYNAVMEREHKMSTGPKHGIGIPHGKTNAVDRLVACLGISDNPVYFEAQDGQPCRIFIMIVSRSDKNIPHQNHTQGNAFRPGRRGGHNHSLAYPGKSRPNLPRRARNNFVTNQKFP